MALLKMLQKFLRNLVYNSYRNKRYIPNFSYNLLTINSKMYYHYQSINLIIVRSQLKFIYIRNKLPAPQFSKLQKKVSFIQNKCIRFCIMLDNRGYFLCEDWIIWQLMKNTCEVQDSITFILIEVYVFRYQCP